jgi:hypothetical protein
MSDWLPPRQIDVPEEALLGKRVFDGGEVNFLGFCREGRKGWTRLNEPALVFRPGGGAVKAGP